MFLTLSAFEVDSGSKVYLLAINICIIILFSLSLASFNEKKMQLNIWDYIKFLYFLFIVTALSSLEALVSLSSVIVLTTAIIIGLIIRFSILNNKKLFIKALKCVLIFNVLLLFLQIISFNFFNVILDVHSTLFPFSEGKQSVVKGLGYGRFTGAYNEPGSYGTWVGMIILVLIILEGKVKKVSCIALLSLPLTFSVSSIIYFTFISMAILVNRNLYRFNLKTLLFSTLFIISAYFILEYLGIIRYLSWRFFDESVVDGTTNLKFTAISHIYNSETWRILAGSGFMINDCLDCESLQDVGLGFNLFFQLGVFSILIALIILFISKPKGVFSIILLAIMFLSKAYIFNNIIWFVILSLSAVASTRNEGR
jgi:hypothetical protein